MGLLKQIKRNPEIAREFAQCVEDNQPYRLLDIKLYLTRRCNLRCRMCNAWASQDGRDELSTDEVIRLVAQANPLGLVNLKLFGGEPMLRQDLEAIVAYAAGLGMRCTLITNGTLLSERRARALVEAGLAQLELSLDAGTPELHDDIRGAPGAWQRAVQGLHWVREASLELDRRVAIRVNTVVMRQNYYDLPKLVGDLAPYVDEVVLNPAVPQEDNRRATSRYTLQREDIVRYNNEIAPLISDRAGECRVAQSPEHLYIYGTADRDIENAAACQYVERVRAGYCFKPWYYAIVRENGDVLGCNTVKHPLSKIGNVRHATLEEIWFSEAYRTFRANCKPPQFADCSRCCYNFALLNKKLEEACRKSSADVR